MTSTTATPSKCRCGTAVDPTNAAAGDRVGMAARLVGDAGTWAAFLCGACFRSEVDPIIAAANAPLEFLELDNDEGLTEGHRWYACPLCPHKTVGTERTAFTLAGLHAGRHNRTAVIVPLTHQALRNPATIAEFAFALEVAAADEATTDAGQLALFA